MITVTLALLSLLQQDPGQDLSPRARAMLGFFPPPPRNEVSVATRFSADTVFAGEQVELVTAAWFPRDLRESLRRAPQLRAPALTGLWSAQTSTVPKLGYSRLVDGRMYDLFITDQTLFPLEAGVVRAPPAELLFEVPTSSSFFAPEDHHALQSRKVSFVVRPIPAELLAELDGGPTAHDLTILWRGPVAGLRTGTPTPIELVVRGRGNVTLWPDPKIAWPAGVHVYPDRTDQSLQLVNGYVGGEKRFRFTVVADSPGVLTLPIVRYPFFDPSTRRVVTPVAPSFAFPVVVDASTGPTRAMLPVGGDRGEPLATRIVQHGWWAMLLIALLPLLSLLRWRRRPTPEVIAPVLTEPEVELRRLLSAPVDAAPERIISALRQRGIARQDAEIVRQWLVAVARKRYGPASSAAPATPEVMQRVLQRLRSVTPLLLLLCLVRMLPAQSDGMTRYRGGDFPGAASALAAEVAAHPAQAGAWRDLAAARWLANDDVGAAAAWLNALNLAPRDRMARAAWAAAVTVPRDVRVLAPVVPLSADELWILALAGWLAAWLCWMTRRRRVGIATLAVTLLCAVGAAMRWHQGHVPKVLLRGNTVMRVSPTLAAPAIGNAPEWSLADIRARSEGWLLIETGRAGSGWIPAAEAAAIGATP